MNTRHILAAIALNLLMLFPSMVRPASASQEGGLPALAARVAALETENSELRTRLEALEDLLVHFSRSGTEIAITGANINIRNGEGFSDTYNGLGNLIIGYNEDDPANGDAPEIRSGSHMLVIGSEHTYSGSCGILAGYNNASLTVGATVTGGFDNTARGAFSSISGGQGNKATGLFSSIGGGLENTASGMAASVAGGDRNKAEGGAASVAGGQQNTALGHYSSVTGGIYCNANGDHSSISGGYDRVVSGEFDWQAGMLWQDE